MSKNQMYVNAREAAELIGISKQRVFAKIESKHFKGVKRCPCGHCVLIPLSEITRDLSLRSSKQAKFE